ncbi:caspase, EACC1-associated type [Microcoleus sp. FACHB-672]|uniref:caspase, EACC1-associated type n=1 Tax=Microcoleus sp. FACHB-672 TaxID=2692825 RepID=UPI001687C6F3|nr:SUMF1/EgtB/PvdO family nonheme iron enzyme [Microcoleus sp. FACHB-672]MBD2041678.1 SUMF1/EgtB/PvdO family nonheme iron enzyme [Microcoleus sp. FACHB-672]
MAKYALLIGVSEYEPGLKPLPAATRDVDAMQEVLLDPEIGEFDEVIPLKNPRLLEMRRAISKLFTDRDVDDLLLLYFSGHGVTDEFGKFFLTNRETEKQSRFEKATALEASFIHDQMDNCGSERQVIILDCCHSGAFPTGMAARDGGMIDFPRQLGGKGRVILTSSAATQYSFEPREGEQLAVYTRYLVEGIKTGAADLDEDGFISINELHEYVKEQVPKAAPSMRPERYVFQEGEAILLAKAANNDRKQQYRKLVEQCSSQDEISPTGRRILDLQRKKLKLSDEEATLIEAEVWQPYREYKSNLKQYEECFQAELKNDFSLGDHAQRELKILQHELNLTDEDVESVTKRIFSSLASSAIHPDKSSISIPPPPPPPLSLPLKPFYFDYITLDKLGKEITRRRGNAYYFTENFDDKVKLEMVYIPGGSFLIGSPETELGRRPNETPQQSVTVKSFLIAKTPITQAQWRVVSSLPKVNLDLHPNPSCFKGSARPVETISWYEAVEFCERLSQRTDHEYCLPTEAEWEYACRAQTTTPFHFGKTITPDIANYDGRYKYASGPKGAYREETTSIKTFQFANAFGLFDMHGNVWEWCLDYFHDSYDCLPNDGSVGLTDNLNQSRVMRGGSWDNDPPLCRSAFRFGWEPEERLNRIGFRVVCQAK